MNTLQKPLLQRQTAGYFPTLQRPSLQRQTAGYFPLHKPLEPRQTAWHLPLSDEDKKPGRSLYNLVRRAKIRNELAEPLLYNDEN